MLTAPITTLLGLGSRPATLGGYGPVITEIGRQLVAKLAGDPAATVCWAGTDPATGQSVGTGRVNTRFFRGLLDEWTDPHGRDYAVDPPKLTDPDPPPF